MMILEQLAQICHEIRLCEALFKMPPHCNIEGELKASGIEHKSRHENNIAVNLFNIVKKYALETKHDCA